VRKWGEMYQLKSILKWVLIGVVFILHYEGYHDLDPNASEFERLMTEPVEPQTVYCQDVECVNKQLALTGPKHITCIYKIEYPSGSDDFEGCTFTVVEIKMQALSMDHRR